MQAALCPNAVVAKPSVARNARRSVTVQAAAYNGQFAEELVQTAVSEGGACEPLTAPWCRQPSWLPPLTINEPAGKTAGHRVCGAWLASVAPEADPCLQISGRPLTLLH